jgi:hypothetical protein
MWQYIKPGLLFLLKKARMDQNSVLIPISNCIFFLNEKIRNFGATGGSVYLVACDGDDLEGAGGLVKDTKGVALADEVGAPAGGPDNEVDPTERRWVQRSAPAGGRESAPQP